MPLRSVHVVEVPDDGLHLACTLEQEELGLEPDEARFHGALTLDADIQKSGRGLQVSGVLSGQVIRDCVRCLKEYEDPLLLSFTAEFRSRDGGLLRPGARTSGAAAPETEEVDEEVYLFDGERLDMADMLREQVILATPMQSLCRKDCLGLCPICGQDRNQRLCGCPEPREPSPFAALKAVRGQVVEQAGGDEGGPRGRARISRNEVRNDDAESKT